MGFFSGILDAVKSVAAPVTEALGAPLISGGLGLLGGMLGNQSRSDIAGKTNAFNAAQSQAQMDFQERMRNTQWQAGVKDMEAAGLNPMLAYSQGGAASPSGAQASGVQAGYENPMTVGLSAAAGLASVEKVRQEARLTRAEADIREADVPYAPRSSEERFRTLVNEADIRAWQQETIRKLNSGTYSGAEPFVIQRFKAETDRIIQQASDAKTSADWNAVRAGLDRLDVPRGLAYSAWYQSPVGKESPAIDLGIRGLSSAAGAVRSLRPGYKSEWSRGRGSSSSGGW